jgi:hypothetical protein
MPAARIVCSVAQDAKSYTTPTFLRAERIVTTRFARSKKTGALF